MNQSRLNEIKELFPCETDTCKRNVDSLVKDSIQQMGVDQTIQLHHQWKILSEKLNNRSKLTCLGDKNHRLMLLEFIKADAASQYKSSYFNRAKIRPQYIQYLQQIGPYVFAQVITIVNKLKLIKKHASNVMTETYSQDHISMKIKEIMQICQSNKRSDNSNVGKFIKIVDFEDREGLIKELGKMLRTAWAKEKEKGEQPEENVMTSLLPIQPQEQPLQPVKMTVSVNSNDREIDLINSYMQDYRYQDPHFWI